MFRLVALFLVILMGACVRPSSDAIAVTSMQATPTSAQAERARQILRAIQAAETRSVLVSMTSSTRGRPDLTPVARQFARYTGTGYLDDRNFAAGLMIFEITDVGGVRGRISGGSIKAYRVDVSIVRLDGEDGGRQILFRSVATGRCREGGGGGLPPCDQAFFELLAEGALYG